jgi:inosine-uridine nucleoside N-ribohydrolase
MGRLLPIAALTASLVTMSCGSVPTPDLARTIPEGREVADDPPLVLFDTDLGPDIDDVLALAMLHGYEDRGLVELASVTVSRRSVTAARYAAAIDTFYGRPDLAVGIDRSAPYHYADADSYVSLVDSMPGSVVADPGSAQADPVPDVGVPDAAAADAAVPDALTILRRALVRAVDEERPVLVIQVGFSGNLAALLDSGPDAISPRTGLELVEATGAVLSIMAGSFDREVGPVPAEFNIAQDVGSARRLIDGWPGELVLSPWELGADLLFPYAAIRDGLPGGPGVPTHPVRQAYEFRDLDWHVDAPPFYDMRTWDLTSVLQGVEPDGGWFPLSDRGTASVAADGSTTFRPGPGRHRVLSPELTARQRERAVDRMIDLVTEPA